MYKRLALPQAKDHSKEMAGVNAPWLTSRNGAAKRESRLLPEGLHVLLVVRSSSYAGPTCSSVPSVILSCTVFLVALEGPVAVYSEAVQDAHVLGSTLHALEELGG